MFYGLHSIMVLSFYIYIILTLSMRKMNLLNYFQVSQGLELITYLINGNNVEVLSPTGT